MSPQHQQGAPTEGGGGGGRGSRDTPKQRSSQTYSVQTGSHAGRGMRKELFISHKYSRFRAGRFSLNSFPFIEFALKIYTSQFKNQARSAKKIHTKP